jgi:hypothetical protein
MAKAAVITCEVMVGLTEKIRQGVEIACELQGIKPSVFMRQCAAEKLVAMGILEAPVFRRVGFNSAELSQAAE